jgi:Initiator Replication protein
MNESPAAQLPLVQHPKPTGSIWEPSKTHPATVPVPLPVVIVRVEGPFTALDRKLWLLLVHNAWDELDSDKPYHEISVAELVRLFRQFGRDDLGARGKVKLGKNEEETEAAALWNSMRRLVKTTVEWEDQDYAGITSLVSEALLNKRYRDTGRIYYAFGKAFTKQILAPRAFARLRCHVVLALRSKYAVTLYEILEAYVNRHESSLTVSIAELQNWLKVPENAYPDWRELKKRVIAPAVKEINEHGEDGGFFVAYEGLREGKSFGKVKFTLTKTAARADRDVVLKDKARRGQAYTAAARSKSGEAYEPTDPVWDKLLEVAPGWDRQVLLARFREWSKGKEPAQNPHGAFINWAKRFTKGKQPSSGALDLRGEGEVTVKLEPSQRVPAKPVEWEKGEASGLSRQQLSTMQATFPGVDIREMEKQFAAWREERRGDGVSAENYCGALNGFIRKQLKRKA